MQHFGVHARCLMAIPLFILSEAVIERMVQYLLHRFAHSGVLEGIPREKINAAVKAGEQLRDSRWQIPLFLVLAAGPVASALGDPSAIDEVNWAAEQGVSLGIGGWWYLADSWTANGSVRRLWRVIS
jgi:hypothetical protein